jgi:hypothetical protein
MIGFARPPCDASVIQTTRRFEAAFVIAEGYFMDGKHRAFSARTKARRTLVAIDLSGIIDPTMIDGNEMGRLRPASEEDVTPPIGTTP